MPEIDFFPKKIRRNLDMSEKNETKCRQKFKTPHNLDKFRKKLDKFRIPLFTDVGNAKEKTYGYIHHR